MTTGSEPNGREVVRSAIYSQHPGIADEIQGAINTLRKLQNLAAAPEADSGAPAVEATADGSSLAPAPAAPNRADVSLRTAASQTPEAARARPLLAAGSTFGRYQIVRLQGRGAMGAVYLAYDPQLQRYVALKTPSLGDCPRAIARFMGEARAAAQLRSPYICPIYDVGQTGDIHFLSMAFIDGQPLSRAIAERQLGDARVVARLTHNIARGLQKAHEQRIIHRDLKPDNIMVDADGEPIVMDFGLARHLDDEVRVTLAGGLLGTPAYMSPEQVDADQDKIGPATDVYSLGVVLYEMLTGRQPFQGSLTAVLRQIVSTQPPRPSSINPAVGEGSPLEHICLKMMARSLAERYSSMAAVVEALEEAFFRERPPVVSPSLWERLASWLGKLFSSRPAASTPAPVPARSGPDPTRPSASQATPAKDKAPLRVARTFDLSQSADQPVDVPQTADQTLDLAKSQLP